MVEWEARCLALEQAYVHEVYHQMGGSEAGAKQHPPWPRVTHFLNQLEPGSIVCDVGCGSGKYLSVNPSVIKLGVDRCCRLAMSAREDQNEVLVCDNLALPFRDESFDAVLSIAVVHHFATTERRITALKELARILRIGGRLVISVWAMEQRHRKFESQDVLVPWHRPQTYSSPSVELTPTTTTSEEDAHHHLYTACTQTSESDSAPSNRPIGTKHKSKHNKEIVVPSPSSSSLSSPNESCYSFVRRAFKKLTGVKRNTPTRPWFLESWTSCTSKDPPARRYDPEGCEDIQDLPIELRHLEGDEDIPFIRPLPASFFKPTPADVSLNHKSKSLSDIITVDQKSLVRSQSSFPSFQGNNNSNHLFGRESYNEDKPKLVKQKQSMCEEDVESEERDEATDMKDLIKSLPEFKISSTGLNRKGNVFKQSSMNEEFMSAERLREKEKVRQNIQKQASLNEELIFNRNKTLDSIRDTFFSASTAKRLQLIKNGLTNKLKSSTTGIEKVSGASIKNGFVRILQGWASGDLNSNPPPTPSPPQPPSPPVSVESQTFVEDKKDQPGERRHSREDGSDSSKDSSLQSDTSVDSEDSFASVIFIPKADQLEQPSSTTSPTLQSTPGSPQPTSPKIKFPPPISPKMKNSTQLTFGLPPYPSSPKLKHPNQLMNSSTPSSPKMKFFPQSAPPRTFQSTFLTSPTSRGTSKFTPSSATNSPQVYKTVVASSKSLPPTYKIPHLTPTSPTAENPKSSEKDTDSPPFITTGTIPKTKSSYNFPDTSQITEDFKLFEDLKPALSPGISPTTPEKPAAPSVEVEPFSLSQKDEETLDENLKIVQEIVRQKVSSRHHQFPLVKRSSTVFGKSDSPPVRSVPRLLSLEIFNPETDDMDSDSSGLSSPDSVGSVISIKNEEEVPSVSEAAAEQILDITSSASPSSRTSGVGAELYPNTENNQESLELKLQVEEGAVGGINLSPRLSPLLEAAAGVATTLEETVETVIQSSPQPIRKHLSVRNDPRMVLQDHSMSSKPLSNEKKNKPISLENTLLSPFRKTIEVPKKLLLDHDKINKERMSFEQGIKMEEQQGKRWDEECRQHLAEFAEKLSEKLLAEIDRYREQNAIISSLSPIHRKYSNDFSDIQDPYLFKLNEDLYDLTKLSIELHEENIAMKAKEMQFIENELRSRRIKGEGASMEEKHIEHHSKLDPFICKLTYPNQTSSLFSMVPDKKTITYLPEEQMPLLGEFSDEGSNFLSSSLNVKPLAVSSFLGHHTSPDGVVTIESKFDPEIFQKDEACNITAPRTSSKEKIVESSEKYGGREETWADSRRNTIMPSGKLLLATNLMAPSIQTIPDISNIAKKEETTKIELLPAKEMPRRPSISIEMTDSGDKTKEEILADCALHLGVSLESSEAGDISERTGSSSEGSRPGSRRDTIQISHSPSIFSLKPGASLESSDAGDISERTGSDGSRESRKDTASLSDITSGSQSSLLRPGNSVESSDAGDTSDRTGSDLSRQNTSSAGKTTSTASITSDKASDCSKDARFADRRMARCDGRSSSEEIPPTRSSMNKLVRQRASTQEPSEVLAKAQSCETTLSGSTSQDSLLSDSGGGAITFHRYYHVFREGELDQLIEKYVENLHIISSYYDHANWCVIAEKVQVWTI